MSTMSTHELAERRVTTGFVVHAAVFVVVNAVLAFINYQQNPDNLWFLWVLGGWGLGLALHGVLAFAVPETRDRMVARTAGRIERRQERRQERML